MIKIAFDPIYAHPLPENHRFPMQKYELIPEQLMYEGTCMHASLGLSLLMLCGLIVRIQLKDNLWISLPAGFFMLLNGYIFYISLGSF